MPPPLPRCSSWAYSSLISPRRVSLPRKGSPGRPAHRPFRGLLGVHSALRPAHSRGHQFVTRYPKASDISSPPCLLRLLPAGANRRVGLAPTGKRRLGTAHVVSSRLSQRGTQGSAVRRHSSWTPATPQHTLSKNKQKWWLGRC